jgi:hypothetical protein
MKAGPPLKREKVDMPEWGEGEWICVREMTVGEMANIRKVYFTTNKQGEDVPNGKQGLNENMIAICAVDESGAAIYDKWNEETRAAIDAFPVKAMLRLTAAITKLNDLSSGDDAEPEAGNS